MSLTLSRTTPTSPALPLTVLVTVVLISMIAPLATDMYVPAFPRVAADLDTTATSVQLTLTTFFVGMALGQLVGGPFSDRVGRRRPLLVSLIVLTVASLLCGLSPSVTVMMLLRGVQGFSGGWAMVIARAIVVDLTSGTQLVRSMGLIAGVTGIAPIIGPLIGAAILQWTNWRISFVVVAAMALLMVLGVGFLLGETLPEEKRHGGGLSRTLGASSTVLKSPNFAALLVIYGFSMGVVFAYVASSAFVLQSINGLSPVSYSIAFAANAVGLTVAALTSARLAGIVDTRRLIWIGLSVTGISGLLLFVGAVWFDMPLWMALIGFFALLTAQGLTGPNVGALASSAVPDHPGTGSALLGFGQWCMAGLIAPLTGLGGEHTAVPMAGIVVLLVAGSMLAFRQVSQPA